MVTTSMLSAAATQQLMRQGTAVIDIWLKITKTQQLTGNMQDSSKIAKVLSPCCVVLSIHSARRVDHKSYSVNTESKKYNGIYSTILCVHIKHTDVERYEFFKHTCLF